MSFIDGAGTAIPTTEARHKVGTMMLSSGEATASLKTIVPELSWLKCGTRDALAYAHRHGGPPPHTDSL